MNTYPGERESIPQMVVKKGEQEEDAQDSASPSAVR